MSDYPIAEIRSLFPGLQRQVNGNQAIFFDGPGGSQSPESVGDAVKHYLLHQNANVGMSFATSKETDSLIEETMRACADFVGCEDYREIVFGQNMTSLTIQLASALSRTWGPGDEVVVTRSDHDANVRPWVLAAQWSGATVKWIDVDPGDCTHKVGTIDESINESTVMVAIGAASNFSGTINDVRGICSKAHSVGAEVFVDAVHYAPHALIDVRDMGCDYLACSSYKFFGTHQGILWGRFGRLAKLPVAKLRVSSEEVPYRWMTGTQGHESMAGTLAAIGHLEWLGRMISEENISRREALRVAFSAIEEYESELCWRMIEGLKKIDGVKIWGITDPSMKDMRAPTVSFTHHSMTAEEVGGALAEQGIFAWAGNFYALELSEALGLEPEGALRVGLLHYNTAEEVDSFLRLLSDILE
ncbi:MAG: cysteine desulfurase-like protein [Candidatus Thalassarchaeum sp.]|uniref:Cysteine desulfurase related protein n=2 Tax=environmental samples TaxID=68359 RepID=A0A075GIM1_9EURY|nr:Cysteine desulfurase related protein [uncultured marine group II/III euryarchaeote KM3_14_H03]AIF19359.1 Cysteine desulfurase related protein [uncultured marine group II/III euryarchaeote KM3_86_F07]